MLILVVRTILIYGLIILAMRLMGKRQLGELQPSELVSTILISNLASISIESQEVPLTASLVPVFLIVCTELLLSGLALHNSRAAQLLSGSPVAVIRDGEIDLKALEDLRFTMSDLMEALRGKDVFDPRQVSYALVEANGSLNLCLKEQHQPVCRQDANLQCPGNQRPLIPFILDGKLLLNNLQWCGRSEEWVSNLLHTENCVLKEVLLLLGNDESDYQLIKKEASRER